jgi:nicotinamidase-related amidase
MKPQNGSIDLSRTALLIIDMQKDFMEVGGFGESLGNDVTKLQRAVEPCRRLLDAARQHGEMLIIHTREGHRSDLTDVHSHKNKSGVIGSSGPMG